MAEYRIKWEIDIEANSPHEAAEQVLLIQRDKDSIASVFTVIDKESCEEFEVDLSEYESKE